MDVITLPIGHFVTRDDIGTIMPIRVSADLVLQHEGREVLYRLFDGIATVHITEEESSPKRRLEIEQPPRETRITKVDLGKVPIADLEKSTLRISWRLDSRYVEHSRVHIRRVPDGYEIASNTQENEEP